MKLVVDRVMVDAAEAFAPYGEVRLVDGRSLTATDLTDTDALLVRSDTRANGEPLHDSPVSFGGTATDGTDHIDLQYLESRNITFASAPGCNARAVGEYVLACVLAFAAQSDRAPLDLRVGIIGCGHAGTAAQGLLEALGVTCLRHDPPRAAREGQPGFVDFERVLQADVVSLHVPLTADGAHPTRGLLDTKALAAMPADSLLINAARGGVVDEQALCAALAAGKLRAAIDCWEGEPQINLSLLDRAWVATPHIAGHSVDARRRATMQIRDALARWTGGAVAPADRVFGPAAMLRLGAAEPVPALHEAVLHCCDPRTLTAVVKGVDLATLSAEFDRLRARFGTRREFLAQPVALPQGDRDTARLLQSVGFPVSIA